MTSNRTAADEPGAFEEKPEVWGYEAVRAAARDYATYSSLLTGDTRVRSYRQLPLELDPPRHSDVRLAIQPVFSAENVSRHDEACRGRCPRQQVATEASRAPTLLRRFKSDPARAPLLRRERDPVTLVPSSARYRRP